MPRERSAQFSRIETLWQYLKRPRDFDSFGGQDRRHGGFPRDVGALPGSDGYKMLVPEMFLTERPSSELHARGGKVKTSPSYISAAH